MSSETTAATEATRDEPTAEMVTAMVRRIVLSKSDGAPWEDVIRLAYLDARALAAPTTTEAPSEPLGLPFGIIDPDYATAYTKIRIAAWQYGYAIGLQGSFTRDLDLIAVPWTAMACPVEHLVKQIEYRSGLKRQGPPKEQPHGRLSWSLLFPGFEDPRWVDLSVVPLRATPPSPD